MIKLITRIGASILTLGLIALMLLPMLPWVNVPEYLTLSSEDFDGENLQPSYTLIDHVLDNRITGVVYDAAEIELTGSGSIMQTILRFGFFGIAVFNIILIILLIASVKWAKRLGIFLSGFSFLLGAVFIVAVFYLNSSVINAVGTEYDIETFMHPTLFAYIFAAAAMIQGILTLFVYKKSEEEYEQDNSTYHSRNENVVQQVYAYNEFGSLVPLPITNGAIDIDEEASDDPQYIFLNINEREERIPVTDGKIKVECVKGTGEAIVDTTGRILKIIISKAPDDGKVKTILIILIIVIMLLIVTLSVVLFLNVIRAVL